MAREAKYIITSEDKSAAGVKSAIRNLSGFDDAAKKVGDSIKTAFSVLALAAFTKQVVQFGAESVKIFGELERKMTILKTALGGNESSFDRLNGFIDKLKVTTMATKGELQDLVAQLASLGKSDADIERITEAAVNLSNVTGNSLDASFKIINGTFTGTAGELSKLIPEVGALTKEQLAAGGAVDLLNAKLGSISNAMAGGVSQKLKNLSDNFGDLRESIGERMLSAFTPFLAIINNTVQILDRLISGWNRLDKAVKDIGTNGAAATDESRQIVMTEKLRIAKESLAALDKSRGHIEEGTRQKLIAQRKEEIQLYEQEIRLMRQAAGAAASAITTPRPAAPSTATGAATDSQDDGFDKLVDQFRVGWREVDSGIGDIVDSIINPPVPTAASSGPTNLLGDMNPISILMDSIAPLTESFSPLLVIFGKLSPLINWMSTIFQGIMEVLGPIIDSLLQPLIGILLIVGQTIGMMLAPALEMLMPIINAVSSLFVFLFNNVVVPVYNSIKFVFNKITNGFIAFANGILAIVDAIPFVNVGRIGYQAEDAGFLNKISIADVNSAGAGYGGGSSGGGGGGGAASYSGSQSITFNFFNQGNVVGSGGLEELATIIQNILQRNARYA